MTRHEESAANTAPDAVTAALVRIVAERGLDAVSVRRVAHAAGVSAGSVQYYFPTKQAMLRAALDSVAAAFQSRVAAVCAGKTPVVALEELARQLVPLDAERAVEGRVWLAFVARAAVDPELAAVHRSGWQQLEDTLANLLATIRDRPKPSAVDRADAGLLLATLDGLAVAGLIEPDRLPPERIVTLLDAQLSALSRGGRATEVTSVPSPELNLRVDVADSGW